MASYDHVHDDPHGIHVHCRSVGALLDDLGRYIPCITFTRLAQRIMHQCPLHLTQSTKAKDQTLVVGPNYIYLDINASCFSCIPMPACLWCFHNGTTC
jgi:hypothetical protein